MMDLCSHVFKKKRFFFLIGQVDDFVISESSKKLTVETVRVYYIISEGSFSLKRFLIVFLPFFNSTCDTGSLKHSVLSM